MPVPLCTPVATTAGPPSHTLSYRLEEAREGWFFGASSLVLLFLVLHPELYALAISPYLLVLIVMMCLADQLVLIC